MRNVSGQSSPSFPQSNQRSKKPLVYTAVFGNYDRVAAVDTRWACEFVCLTDNPALVSSGWKIVLVSLGGEEPTIANRRLKILAHRFFPDYEMSLYVDGNIRIIRDPYPLFQKNLARSSIAAPIHPERTCAYDEADLLLKSARLTDKDKITLRNQIRRYAQEGFPRNSVLTENNVILRRHNQPEIIRLTEHWWREFEAGAPRDQVSLPYVLWAHSQRIQFIDESPRFSGKYFDITLHLGQQQFNWINKSARLARARKQRNAFYKLIAWMVGVAMRFRAIARD